MSAKSCTCCSLAILLATVLLAGCGGQQHSLSETVAQCAKLAGASSSENEALRREILQLEKAAQTPLALTRRLPDPDENAAAILADALSDGARLRLGPRLADVLPDDRFLFDSTRLQEVADVVQGAARIRRAVRAADQAPYCVFNVQTDRGYFADMRFLDDAAIAARLHIAAAAPALATDQMSLVLEEVEGAVRWIDRLAAVGRIEARLLAAQLRGEAITVIEAAADRPAVQRADFEQFYELLRGSLDDWPLESAPLVGDRAVALHTYEAIRAGLFDELVTPEEKQMLEARGLLRSMQSLGATQIDSDQLAYLGAMRALIGTTTKPHYQRTELIEQIMAPFDPDEARSVETPLAANLLLPGLPRAMREIALDRAACEVWAIALAAAAEMDLPPYKRNPVTGQDYEIDRLSGGLIVRSGDSALRDAYVRTLP